MEKKIAIVTAIMMSGFMAFVLSGVFTLLNVGFGIAWLFAWLQGFSIAWPLALVLALVAGKPISSLARRLVGG